MAKIRDIAYDQTFLDQAALLEADALRLDAMLDGVLWEIATHAEEQLKSCIHRSFSRRPGNAHFLFDHE